MKVATIILSSVLGSVLVVGGFFFLKKYEPMKNSYLESKMKLTNMDHEVKALKSELNQKVAEISKTQKEKEDEIGKISSTKDSLISAMAKEIEGNQVKITQLADKLQVSIVDKILFPSGKANISTEGLQVLKRVGTILGQTEDKMIRVEGHTDNVPITGRLKKKFPTNWELSTARATNVVRFLNEEVGISPSRLEAVGLSEYQPVSTNDTKEGKAQNRRIEIALLPLSESP